MRLENVKSNDKIIMLMKVYLHTKYTVREPTGKSENQ